MISIVKIKSVVGGSVFNFPHVTPSEVHNVIMSLNPSKTVSGPFSTKVVQNISNIICVPLTDCINAAISECKFSHELKQAEVVPVFKKGDKTLMENYRPINILLKSI